MGIHERAEEVLALADYSGARPAGQSHCPHARVGRGAVYLHIVLVIGVVQCLSSEELLSASQSYDFEMASADVLVSERDSVFFSGRFGLIGYATRRIRLPYS